MTMKLKKSKEYDSDRPAHEAWALSLPDFQYGHVGPIATRAYAQAGDDGSTSQTSNTAIDLDMLRQVGDLLGLYRLSVQSLQ